MARNIDSKIPGIIYKRPKRTRGMKKCPAPLPRLRALRHARARQEAQRCAASLARERRHTLKTTYTKRMKNRMSRALNIQDTIPTMR
jgi:hypothetical protein